MVVGDLLYILKGATGNWSQGSLKSAAPLLLECNDLEVGQLMTGASGPKESQYKSIYLEYIFPPSHLIPMF